MNTIFGNSFLGSVQRREVTSEATEGRYEIFISLPAGYDQAKRNYPLLIALDANFCVGTVVETAALQARIGDAEGVIIVSVGTLGGLQEHWFRRLRDYLPGLVPPEVLDTPFGKNISSSFHVAGLSLDRDVGHADSFLSFLQDELLPSLSAEFRIDMDDVGIAGHSAGGAFVSHVLLTRASPFRKLILASFSTVWYGKELDRYEAAFSSRANGHPIQIQAFFGGGELADPALGGMLDSSIEFLHRLAAMDPNLNLEVRVSDKETHGSIPAQALASGIRAFWPGPGYGKTNVGR